MEASSNRKDQNRCRLTGNSGPWCLLRPSPWRSGILKHVGVVAAQAADSSEGTSFAARVAEILNLDEQTVEDAMTQAKRDMREEAMKSRLDELVAAGDMTQDDADEYMTWLESAPDTIYGHKGRQFGKGHRGRGMRH